MMFIGHDSERYGYLCLNGAAMQPDFIARRCGIDVAQYRSLLAELDAARIPERTPDGIIYSRRMVRDDQKRRASIRFGRKGGNPKLLNEGDNRGVNPPDNPDMNMKMKLKMEDGIPKNLDTEDFLDAWISWKQHRMEKRQRLTPTAIKFQISKLEKLGPTRAVAAIHHSIANGYQGIFEPAPGNGTGRSNGNPSPKPQTLQKPKIID